jgi:hypothetical protein
VPGEIHTTLARLAVCNSVMCAATCASYVLYVLFMSCVLRYYLQHFHENKQTSKKHPLSNSLPCMKMNGSETKMISMFPKNESIYYQVAGKPLSKQHQSAPLTFRILPSAYKAAAEGGRKPRRGARKHCSLQNARMTCICSGLHTASKHPLMCDGIDGRHAACDATS